MKDAVPWGSAIGLRINSLWATANIAATGGVVQDRPRSTACRMTDFYDLRVTGELWETYYYDYLCTDDG